MPQYTDYFTESDERDRLLLNIRARTMLEGKPPPNKMVGFRATDEEMAELKRRLPVSGREKILYLLQVLPVLREIGPGSEDEEDV